MLLESDADINQVTSSGTCLHEAALYGKTDVVKLLLEVSKTNASFLYFPEISTDKLQHTLKTTGPSLKRQVTHKRQQEVDACNNDRALKKRNKKKITTWPFWR